MNGPEDEENRKEGGAFPRDVFPEEAFPEDVFPPDIFPRGDEEGVDNFED